MQERVPAQNIEAEQSVLSAILIDNNVMEKIEEILKRNRLCSAPSLSTTAS